MATVFVIGGHSCDEEVMAGTLISKLRREGHTVRLLSLTNGDGGHPRKSREEYGRQKEEEARRAAEVLGAQRVSFGISSGRLEVSLAVQERIAEEIRTHRPAVIITHWRGSIHRDHIATYDNVRYAVAMARNPAATIGGEPYAVPSVLYADNIEDPKDYFPDIIVETTEEDEALWLKSCQEYEVFREAFYDFDYRRYYEALHIMRGQMSGKRYRYGCALMRDKTYSYLATSPFPDLTAES